MTAQRDCINHAAGLIKNIPGVVFELGLGNGRSYDHMRQTLPDRDIYVFDRQVCSLSSCRPPDEKIFIGEVVHTLIMAGEIFSKKGALLHNDLGTSDCEKYKKLMDEITPLLESILMPGAIIISNTPIHTDAWERISGPQGIKQEHYYLYRAIR